MGLANLAHIAVHSILNIYSKRIPIETLTLYVFLYEAIIYFGLLGTYWKQSWRIHVAHKIIQVFVLMAKVLIRNRKTKETKPKVFMLIAAETITALLILLADYFHFYFFVSLFLAGALVGIVFLWLDAFHSNANEIKQTLAHAGPRVLFVCIGISVLERILSTYVGAHDSAC